MQLKGTESIEPRRLGGRLQEARAARGLTQQDLADVLGLARTTITAIEKGERREHVPMRSYGWPAYLAGPSMIWWAKGNP